MVMKTFFKFLSNNKFYTAIELFGLSVSLGFVLLLSSYAYGEFRMGAEKACSKQVYVVGTGEFMGMTMGLGPEFFPSIPEISSFTRKYLYKDACPIKFGDEVYEADVEAIDTNFFQMFDYELVGQPRERVLSRDDEAILSQSFARKVFGSDNPVGLSIQVDGKPFTVTGIMEDFGREDVFNPSDIFVSAKCGENNMAWMDNWGVVQTFLTLSPGATREDVKEKILDKLIDYLDGELEYGRDSSDGTFIWGVTLTRLDEIYFSPIMKFGTFRSGDKSQVLLLLLACAILLVSAIFNYINLSIAQTGRRSKEMATRRLLGESHLEILSRYIRESFVFTSICFVLGVMFAILSKPLFESILSKDFQLLPDVRVLGFAVLLLIAVSLVSGVVPATMALRFKPIDVIKGNFRFKSKAVFSKIFIVLQSALGLVLMAVSGAMVLQLRYLTEFPMGYNTDGIMLVESFPLSKGGTDLLASRLASLPQVEVVGRSNGTPLKCSTNGLRDNDGHQSWFITPVLDSTSFRILGFRPLEQFCEPVSGYTWFTVDAAQRFGITKDKPEIAVSSQYTPYKACGIIDDFLAHSPLTVPEDDSHAVITINNDSWYELVLKIASEKTEAKEAVRDVCLQVATETCGYPMTLEINYIEDILKDGLSERRNFMTFIVLFMCLSLLISVLGLVAMSLYYTEQQSRSLAIRKIFGSGFGEAIWRVTRGFSLMVLASILIATPISIWVIDTYLQGYYRRIAFPWWVIVVAVVLSLLIAFLSIIYQAWRAASRNAIETLGQE